MRESVLFLLQDKAVFIFLICWFVFFFFCFVAKKVKAVRLFSGTLRLVIFFPHFSFVGSELACY